MPLPVKHIEDINCWENVEYSLLKLDNEQFKILFKDRLRQLEEERIKTLSKESKVEAEKRIVVSKKLDALPEGALDDPFIREMEKTLAQGDENSVREMLKTFKL